MQIICCIHKDFVRQVKAFLPSFCHLCACEMSTGSRHSITWMDPSVGHSNGILSRVRRNLNNKFQKSQIPRGLPGEGGGAMLKLRFDWYIITSIALEKCKKNAIWLKIFWYKVFVHWKSKLLNFLMDSVLSLSGRRHRGRWLWPWRLGEGRGDQRFFARQSSAFCLSVSIYAPEFNLAMAR